MESQDSGDKKMVLCRETSCPNAVQEEEVRDTDYTKALLLSWMEEEREKDHQT